VVPFTAGQFAASATAVEVAAEVGGVCVVLAVKVVDTELVDDDDEVVALATDLQDRCLSVMSPIHNEQKEFDECQVKTFAVIDDA
jgi:hypothetical protein